MTDGEKVSLIHNNPGFGAVKVNRGRTLVSISLCVTLNSAVAGDN